MELNSVRLLEQRALYARGRALRGLGCGCTPADIWGLCPQRLRAWLSGILQRCETLVPPHRAGCGSLQPFGNREGLCPTGHTLLSQPGPQHAWHLDQQITDTFEAITQEFPDSPSLRLSVRPSSFLFFSSSPYLGLSAAHLLLAPHSSISPSTPLSLSISLPLSASFMVDLLK